MANVFATKTGNWSDPTVWNTGALPTSADDVWANNFVVNADTNTTIRTLRNTSTTGIAAGGRFELQNGVNITCTVTPGVVPTTSTSPVVFSQASPATATLNAVLRPGTSNSTAAQVLISGTGTFNLVGSMSVDPSGDGVNSRAIIITNVATLNIVGNVANRWRQGADGVYVTAAGVGTIINITGDLIAGPTPSTENPGAYCIVAESTITVNVVGNCYWATVNQDGGRGGCFNLAGSPVVTITGNITGSNLSQVAGTLVSIGGGILNCVGTIQGGAAAIAVSGPFNTFVTGPLIQSTTGIQPLVSSGWRWRPTFVPTYYAVRNSANTGYRNLFSSDNSNSGANQAIPTNVRLNTTYGPTNEFTGTMKVPAPNQVISGIPVDGTVGTAVISSEGLTEALIAASVIILDQPASSLNTPGSIGERLKNVSTVESVGEQIAAFGP
jgi:hypothetical protein